MRAVAQSLLILIFFRINFTRLPEGVTSRSSDLSVDISIDFNGMENVSKLFYGIKIFRPSFVIRYRLIIVRLRDLDLAVVYSVSTWRYVRIYNFPCVELLPKLFSLLSKFFSINFVSNIFAFSSVINSFCVVNSRCDFINCSFCL